MIHRGGITALQAKGSFMIDWKLIHQLQKDFYYHYATFSEMKVFVIPFCWSESMDQFPTIFSQSEPDSDNVWICLLHFSDMFDHTLISY